MENESLYRRLAASINLAVRGSTPGERESGRLAASRIVARLPQAELQVLQAVLFPDKIPFPKAKQQHRKGTKRQAIIELLNQGFVVSDIALRLDVKKQYVYRVRYDMRHSL